MSKVAVCFYGLLRTNPLVVGGLLENLIQPLKAEVFVCCPKVFFSRREQESIRAQDNPEEVSDRYLLKAFGGYLKAYKIIPYDPQTFKNAIKAKNLPETTTLLVNEGQENQWEWTGYNYRTLSMFYQIREVIRLCKAYEKGGPYSTIVLLRPDLIIRNRINLEGLDLNKLYSTGDHLAPVFGSDRKIGDHLLVSKRDNMMKLAAIYENIPGLHQEGVKINNETILGHFLLRHHIPFEYSPFLDHTVERGDTP